MRAFLAADSCPSRRRRSTSCSSWVAQGLVTELGGTGPGYQDGASHSPQIMAQRRKQAQEGQSRAWVESQVSLHI